MNMRELTARTGVAERQVRYLIAEGLIPPPRGGRATANYGEDHVAAIRRYGALRELGFPPAAIRLLLQTREGAPFPVMPGVTLVIDPDLIGTDTPIAQIRARIDRILTEVFDEGENHDHADSID